MIDGSGFHDGPVLGIETSCDETSAAVLIGSNLAGHVILSQDAHERFGGIVPEISFVAEVAPIQLRCVG